MTRPRAASCAAAALLAALAAGSPADARNGQIIVRNDSFSALEISVLAGRDETAIGSAPPEFSNTLYFPVPSDASRIRFRARLPGSREVLHESDPVDTRAGLRVRWLLPENAIETLRGRGIADHAPRQDAGAGADPQG